MLNSIKKIVCMFFIFFITQTVTAVDYTDKISEQIKFKDWQVVEFLGATFPIYRLATTSINHNNTNIVFDFSPSNECIPSAAKMIQNLEMYKKDEFSGDGLMMFAFKFPKQKTEIVELVKTFSEINNSFMFILFKKLTVESFKALNDKGRLAIWVPKGFKIKRSNNIYFSINGFTAAYNRARELCMDNM